MIAHRGGAAHHPENTLEAFAAALALGVSFVELDVHLSRDGELVVVHDDTLDRTTDGTGPVAAYSLAELRELDADHHFGVSRSRGALGEGARIPTLDEVMGLDARLRAVVEMKPRGAEIARAVWRFVEARALHDRVLVAHAHGGTLRAFRRLAEGSVATSAGEDEIRRFWALSRARAESLDPPRYDALQVPERTDWIRVVDRRFVEAAHGRGLEVHVWTVNDAPAMDRLLDLGVDGLITDDPRLANEVVARRRARGISAG